jgi:hypothetical protein
VIPGFRVILVLVTMLCVLWLASGLGPVRDERAGIAALDDRPAPQDVARAYRLLERAAAKTRSSVPDLRLAQLDAFTGRHDRAVRRLEPLVAREPENFDAWLLLSQTARTVDPAKAARARERVRRLSPPVPVDR